ncbi:MAG: alpha/beta hydrolase [Chloroflexi bacterium HGW-Chloroflexi-4]|jgi:acetyl esterase/lipase|nr:MAG: alpha/beta hydrolase [Chloroflexi bacterium HGW-Chloroflexi-4]
MGKYKIHADFVKYEKIQLPLAPWVLPILNGVISTGFDMVKLNEGVKSTKRTIPGYQGGLIDITIYEPENIQRDAPCLVYLHGGAFVLKASPYLKTLVCTYALKTPCKVVYVDYRLAPKFAFPVGAEDCYVAFEWVHQHAQELGIDANKIAIGGDSAGGALAAAVNLMALDRNTSTACFQLLIYPVTDARQETDSIKQYIDTPLWNSRQTEKMWKLYLKSELGADRGYASPIEAASLEGLPPTYIEVAEFDCLRDEGINFAEALQKSGVQVELIETIGTIHGFEIAESSEFVHQIIEKRIDILKTAFNNSD